MMRTIDYIFRFDPKNPAEKTPPANAEEALATLEAGNRMFCQWVESCRTSDFSPGEPRYVVHCNGAQVGFGSRPREAPRQTPFAVVIGCSDARVPTELIFAQGLNELFVIRVAGNILAEECLGSVDFALTQMRESVKVVVVCGHMSCGAVTAAVDAYLEPRHFWQRMDFTMLPTLLHRLFIAVREADACIQEVWGASARKAPEFRQALIDTAVCVNAARVAHSLQVDIARANSDVPVLFGVYDLVTHAVCMPPDPKASAAAAKINLAVAPSDPSEFDRLGLRMAELLHPANLA